MLRYLNQKRGQSTLEYSLIVAAVVAALIAMQVYLRRGVQGKIKQSADEIGEQFSPTNTTSSYTTTTRVTTEEKTLGGENPKSTSTSRQSQTTTGYEQVNPDE